MVGLANNALDLFPLRLPPYRIDLLNKDWVCLARLRVHVLPVHGRDKTSL